MILSPGKPTINFLYTKEMMFMIHALYLTAAISENSNISRHNCYFMESWGNPPNNGWNPEILAEYILNPSTICSVNGELTSLSTGHETTSFGLEKNAT